MKTNHLVLFIFLLALAIALSGCAGMSASKSSELSCTRGSIGDMLRSGTYNKKVDNFIIVQDATPTMNERSGKSSADKTKLELSKGLVGCLNNSLVEDMKLMGGMRVFGSHPSDSGLVYGMSHYTKAGLEEGVQVIQTTGSRTDLTDAGHDAANDLKLVSGYSAVIIFSDGRTSDNLDPVAAAADLKKTYGDRVCIYTVLLGDDPDGKAIMEDIANQGGCGFAVTAAELYMKPLEECDTVNTGRGMGDFAARVFLDRDDDRDGVINSRDRCPGTPPGIMVDNFGCPLDTDRDGIPDSVDKCPQTTQGYETDEFGCPLDIDRDGIPDGADRCPETPQGVKIDEFGCPIPLKEKISITLLVEFDFDKDEVKFLYHQDIEKVAALLQTYPKTNVTLEGHTDSIGPEDYNMELGRRRAESVRQFLVDKFGIDAARISIVSHGESMPVDTNDTVVGRQNNRRVVALIEAVAE